MTRVFCLIKSLQVGAILISYDDDNNSWMDRAVSSGSILGKGEIYRRYRDNDRQMLLIYCGRNGLTLQRQPREYTFSFWRSDGEEGPLLIMCRVSFVCVLESIVHSMPSGIPPLCVGLVIFLFLSRASVLSWR